jgi:hypothetical protein
LWICPYDDIFYSFYISLYFTMLTSWSNEIMAMTEKKKQFMLNFSEFVKLCTVVVVLFWKIYKVIVVEFENKKDMCLYCKVRNCGFLQWQSFFWIFKNMRFLWIDEGFPRNKIETDFKQQSIKGLNKRFFSYFAGVNVRVNIEGSQSWSKV